MLSREDFRDDRILKWSQFTPSKTVDDVMLQGGVKLLEMAHSSSSISSTLDAPIAWRSIAVSSDSLMVKA